MLLKALAMSGLVLLFAVSICSQQLKTIKIDSDGDFHLGTTTAVGSHLLEPGMYRISLITINGQSFVAFEKLAMLRYRKAMWPNVRTELFRIAVNREAGEPVERTTLTVVKQEKRQTAVQFRFKHDASLYVVPPLDAINL